MLCATSRAPRNHNADILGAPHFSVPAARAADAARRRAAILASLHVQRRRGTEEDFRVRHARHASRTLAVCTYCAKGAGYRGRTTRSCATCTKARAAPRRIAWCARPRESRADAPRCARRHAGCGGCSGRRARRSPRRTRRSRPPGCITSGSLCTRRSPGQPAPAPPGARTARPLRPTPARASAARRDTPTPARRRAYGTRAPRRRTRL